MTFRDDDLATDDQLRVALASRHRTTRRIALDQNLHAAAGRYCNFYSLYCHVRQFAEGEWVYADGIVYCDDHDITTYATFLRSERTRMLEQTGRWDEALAVSQEILDMPVLAPATRVCPLNRTGTILARRGDPAAWEHLDDGMNLAESSGEPLQIAPVRLTRAEAYRLEGRTAEAAREAELAAAMPDPGDPWLTGALAACCGAPGPPAARRRDGRALPAPAQRPLGEGGPAVDRPGLPVRGRAGPAGHGRREPLRRR